MKELEKEMTIGQQINDALGDRRLERAAHHVAMHWFPINTALVQKIAASLKEGRYTDNLPALIAILKNDFALFTFIVKELITLAEEDKVPVTICADPIRLLEWAGVERIGSILLDEASLPRSHTLAESDPILLKRLCETSLVAATSEVIGSANSLDKDTAFCNGLIREVGLNLVAWNYSSLYSRVLKGLTRSSSLDMELSRELGFSPTLLAFKFLRPKISTQSPEAATLLQSWKTYDDLCAVGESLARAGHPETYPSAENDWKKVHEFLTSSVGPNGVDLIRARAIESTLVYRRSLPSTFPSLENFNPAVSIKRHQRSQVRENPFIPSCPPAVQNALRAVYAQMPQNSVNRGALEKLIKEVVPLAGFTGGCVFLVDPASMALVPRTVIGNVTLRTLGSVPLPRTQGSHMATLVGDVITTNIHLTDDYARVAFDSEQPVVQRSTQVGPYVCTGIYSRIGKERRIGVLYLEAPESLLHSSGLTIIKVFKAIHQTLCHSLFVD